MTQERSEKRPSHESSSGVLLRRHIALISACVAVVAHFPRQAQAQLSGQLGAHDPSSVVKEGSNYYYFATGQGIISRTSTNRVNWSAGSSIFTSPPAWTTTAVTNFTGFFWAPDVAYFNGRYHVYYSCSNWGTIDSAIGLVTTPSLANPTWVDRGKVVQSDAIGQTSPTTDTTAYNAIDPSVMVDSATGRVWMSFGSYSSGILVTELDPATGLRKNTGSLQATQVANNSGGGWGSSIEGSALVKHGSSYYLFVNYGTCCSGVDSTYNIRVGRSASPTGPFVDKNGVDLRSGGGSMFLTDDGKMIGPGHFSTYSESGQDYFGYHYYNGDTNGTPTYGLRSLYWTSDNWPSYAPVNPDWNGANNANWSDATNWSAGGVPSGVGHIANFISNSSGRYTVAVDGGARTVSTINFRSPSSYTVGTTSGNTLTLVGQTGDSATLNVAQGHHTLAAPIVAVNTLGVNTFAGTHLSLNGSLSGTGLTKFGHGTLSLNGATTLSDAILVKWGFLEINGTLSTSKYTSLGQVAGEGGVMILRGTGTFNTTADFNVGDTGNSSTAATGWLEIHNSAAVNVNSVGGFFVGSGFSANTKATGTVTQDGGTLTVTNANDGYFIVGGRNSSLGVGTYNLAGGAINANTNVRIGGQGTGTMNQTAGAFTTAKWLSIGRFAGATGVYNISGGTLSQTSASTAIIVGEAGTGTLNISGTASVSAVGGVSVGRSGGSGVVNLDGGILTTTHFSRGTGAATLNFDGGTARASANDTAFLPNTILTTIEDGGAVFDSNGFSITVAAPLRHDTTLGNAADGGLTKSGNGTLTLSGSSTYSGKTQITSGMLSIAGTYAPSVTTSASLTVSGTAIANIRGSATFTSVRGTNVTITNGGRLTIATSDADGAGTGIRGARGAVSIISKLSIDGQSRFDLKNNALIIPATGQFNGSTITASALRAALVAGRGGVGTGAANWNGAGGIVTSLFAFDETYDSIGYVWTGDPNLLVAPANANGETYAPGDYIIKYTAAADADLNGVVDDTDVAVIGLTYSQGGTTGRHWYEGDFNYDGRVNDDDVAILGLSYNPGGVPLKPAFYTALAEQYGAEFAAAFDASAHTTVPEPALLGPVIFSAIALLRRKRGRR